MHRAVIVSAALVLGACDPKPKSGSEPPDAPEGASPAAPRPVAEEDPPPPAGSPLREAKQAVVVHMPEHLRRAGQIRDALVFGRLTEARPHAEWLASHWPQTMLESWVPFIQDLRAAAGEIAQAQDSDAASLSMGRLALSCGNCHAAQKSMPTLTPPPLPAEGPEAQRQMQRHRWATDRLWEGIVQDSSSRWLQGVDAFGEMPPCRENLGGEQLTEAIARSRDTTERLRAEARDDADASLDARSALYGRLLQTCGDCHNAGC